MQISNLSQCEILVLCKFWCSVRIMHCIFLFVSDEDAPSEHVIAKCKIDFMLIVFCVLVQLLVVIRVLPLTRNLAKYLVRLQLLF